VIKLALSGAGLAPFAVIGLLIFVGVFVGVGVWAFSRTRREVAGWSNLPLVDGDAAPRPPASDLSALVLPVAPLPGKKSSCGKCEHCDCV
jgi:cbb3-type cytochrome oxidase subunit 3